MVATTLMTHPGADGTAAMFFFLAFPALPEEEESKQERSKALQPQQSVQGRPELTKGQLQRTEEHETQRHCSFQPGAAR